MKICPKCGFENELATPACLKCGVIFAKVEQARSNDRNALQKESAINQKIEKVMTGNLPVNEGLYLLEKEALRDRDSLRGQIF